MVNELAEKIQKILGDVASVIVARSALAVQCKRLNLTTDTISKEDLDKVADGLDKSLRLLGIDTKDAVLKIKALK